MKRLSIFGILAAIAGGHLAWGHHERVGLLTETYGILASEELDREEERCSDIRPFPDENACFNYWQCLPTRDLHMSCIDHGYSDENGRAAEAAFSIADGDQVHHYGTRRSFGLEVCREWVKEWQEVIQGEDIVCISGTYNGSGDSSEGPQTERMRGAHHFWTIDRLKSRHNRWSYFADEWAGTYEKTADTKTQSLENAQSFRSLLTDEDHRLAEADRRKGPALSAAPDAKEYWESYNEWLCFTSSDATVERAEVLYDGEQKFLPQMRIQSGNHVFEISLSAETRYANDRIAEFWKDLLRKSPAVCVYAARLQSLAEGSLWTVSRIRTEAGHWDEEDERD